ncbi:response regulator [Desulfobacterales bacterium HSG17]|nr:response regulator [Desulfobacterales bacterium HSG17]
MEKYQILIIEDETELLKQWENIFKQEGYDVDIAENGKQALELWEKNIYDLVIVDLKMPEVDGREVINTIKSNQPLTQIIIISGHGDNDDMIDAINQHVYKYLAKPADLDEILQAAIDALEKRDPLLRSLEEMAEEDPDKPLLLIGKEKYSPRRMYDEVRTMTPLGKKFHEDFMKSLTELKMPKDDLSVDDLLGIKSVVD